VLHPVEPKIPREPSITVFAPVNLNLTALVLPLATADDVFAVAVRTGDPDLCAFQIPPRGVLLHIVFQLEGELNCVDMLADHVSGRVIRA